MKKRTLIVILFILILSIAIILESGCSNKCPTNEYTETSCREAEYRESCINIEDGSEGTCETRGILVPIPGQVQEPSCYCTGGADNRHCGDGETQQEIGEECDDGNTNDRDGCSADCKFVCEESIELEELEEEFCCKDNDLVIKCSNQCCPDDGNECTQAVCNELGECNSEPTYDPEFFCCEDGKITERCEDQAGNSICCSADEICEKELGQCFRVNCQKDFGDKYVSCPTGNPNSKKCCPEDWTCCDEVMVKTGVFKKPEPTDPVCCPPQTGNTCGDLYGAYDFGKSIQGAITLQGGSNGNICMIEKCQFPGYSVHCTDGAGICCPDDSICGFQKAPGIGESFPICVQEEPCPPDKYTCGERKVQGGYLCCSSEETCKERRGLFSCQESPENCPDDQPIFCPGKGPARGLVDKCCPSDSTCWYTTVTPYCLKNGEILY